LAYILIEFLPIFLKGTFANIFVLNSLKNFLLIWQ
jgi:hypothetical protein